MRYNLLKRKKIGQKGFSLPELIIVIAIFVIITTVALFNQGRLSSSVLLTNMAYEVGLAVREAQIYGIGVRSTDASGNFAGQFGAHFDTNNDKQVIVFADMNNNGQYDAGVGDESRYVYEFDNRRGNRITAVCVGGPGVGWSSGPCNADVNQQSVDVLFKRPNPSNLVSCADTSPGVCPSPLQSNRVYIVISDVEDLECRVVIVEATGQIRVEDSTKGSCSAGASLTP